MSDLLHGCMCDAEKKSVFFTVREAYVRSENRAPNFQGNPAAQVFYECTWNFLRWSHKILTSAIRINN